MPLFVEDNLVTKFLENLIYYLIYSRMVIRRNGIFIIVTLRENIDMDRHHTFVILDGALLTSFIAVFFLLTITIVVNPVYFL